MTQHRQDRAFWGTNLLIVAVVATMLLLAVGWFAYHSVIPREFVSQAEINAEIARELPRGSSEVQIFSFLEQKKWSPDGPTRVTAPVTVGVPDGTLWITGLIPHAGRDWFSDYDLGVYFILDDTGQLDRVILRTANYVGP